MKAVTVAALVIAGLGQLVVTASEPGYNTAVGMTIGLAFLGMAGAAATGRWWALGLVALISGLLTIAAVGQLLERLDEESIGEVVQVLAFLSMTLTAATAGSAAAIRGYRARDHKRETEARNVEHRNDPRHR